MFIYYIKVLIPSSVIVLLQMIWQNLVNNLRFLLFIIILSHIIHFLQPKEWIVNLNQEDVR